MAAEVYYIPAGPKNLKALFPTIPWESVGDYWIEVLASGTIIATTPMIVIGCCCGPEDIVVHFLNYLGAIDSIPFSEPKITHESKSSLYRKSLDHPLQRTDYGWQRFNVKSNDIYECSTNCYDEDDRAWIQEVFDSTFAFLQVTGKQGLPDSYIPITILDGTWEKSSDIFKMQFRLANEYVIQRN